MHDRFRASLAANGGVLGRCNRNFTVRVHPEWHEPRQTQRCPPAPRHVNGLVTGPSPNFSRSFGHPHFSPTPGPAVGEFRDGDRISKATDCTISPKREFGLRPRIQRFHGSPGDLPVRNAAQHPGVVSGGLRQVVADHSAAKGSQSAESTPATKTVRFFGTGLGEETARWVSERTVATAAWPYSFSLY